MYSFDMKDIQLILRYFPIHSAFLLTVLGMVVFYVVKGSRSKALAISAWGIVFISLYSSISYAFFTFFLAWIVFFICRVILKSGNKKIKTKFLIMGIAISIASLCIFKYPIFDKYLPSFAGLKALGISYFTFKFIHVMVDIWRGRIKQIDFWSFFAFISFFPAFSAGPIDRYGRFSKDLDKIEALHKEDIDIGITRIIYGLFKKFIIADKTGKLILVIAPDILKADRPILWLVVFLYSVKIYYDFSGYTDIAIGAGRLFGFKLPENFNKPYLKKNIVLFWQNWHMSLTSWLREYLFMPLGKTIMRKIGTGHPWLINTICQIITMGIVGIWHGSTWNFFIWGLYHGIGLSLYRIYADILNSYASEKLKAWMDQSRAWLYIATAINFVFVSVGWIFFMFKWNTALAIIENLF